MEKAIHNETLFRVVLQEELLKRCKRNQGYSLRSFARSLEINPSSLSRILRGERSISEKMKHRLGECLGLPPSEIVKYDASKVFPTLTHPMNKPRFNALPLDRFRAISDWYHYAILELTHVDGFQPKPRWISAKLGITPSEVNAAVERLVRLGFLKISETGYWINQSGNNTNINVSMKDAAHRKLQKQVLKMALHALDEIPIEKRDQTSMTMSIDSSLLPEAAKRIANFRRELCAFLEQGKSRDQVYQLSISLYPLTKTTEKGGQT